MKKLFIGATLLCSGGALLLPNHPAQAQTISVVSTSSLAGMPLPPQTMSFASQSVPKEVTDALDSMMQAAGINVKRGRTEVLGWSGNGYSKAHAKEWKARIGAALKKAGWEYEEGDKVEGAEGATMVSAMRTTPTRKALIGFWAPSDEALVLAWTEMLPAKGGANSNTGIVPPGTPDSQVPAEDTAGDTADAAPAPAKGTVVNISEGQYVLNAAKSLPEPHVTFPKLAPIAGKARGYVYGTDGKPLKGALIGVASTAVGGAETSGSTKTDAKGYYELLVPFGVARFYASGYTKEYGDGVLGMGLSPSDGEADEFASNKGHVENWILKPYGIADRAGVQDQPQYLNNYYGGAIVLEFLNEQSMMAGPKGLPFGSTVEVTLTPKGPLMDGSRGQTLVVRKVIKEGDEMRLYVNNIPVGTYTISARDIQGSNATPINMRETGPDRGRAFGISPKEANGSAELMFRPYSAELQYATAGHGNWRQVQIDLKLQ